MWIRHFGVIQFTLRGIQYRVSVLICQPYQVRVQYPLGLKFAQISVHTARYRTQLIK